MAISIGLTGQEVAYKDVTDMSVMVGNAIEHLTALVKRINEAEKLHLTFDQSSVDAISSALKELDSERLMCHEQLEIETIKASSLRHKLAKFPREIEAEIRGAVASARYSNEAEIKSLQKRIGSVNNTIAIIEQHSELKLLENISLEPQKEQLETEYKHTIALLNQSLADKSSLQIKLNETRKKLKETHEEIEDLEKALDELGEEMVDERKEAKLEKNRLQKAVFETTKEVEEQKVQNSSKKEEINDIGAELKDYELKIRERDTKLQQFVKSISKLEAQRSRLSNKLEQEIHQNTELTKLGMKIVKKGAESSDALSAVANELKKKLSEIGDEAGKSAKEFNRLHAERMKLINDLDEAKAAGSKGKDEALEVERKLRRIKDDLMHNTRECVRLKQENEDTENVTDRLKQEHQASMEILNKKLNDLGVALNAERKERLELQNRRDFLTKDSSAFKTEYTKEMTELTQQVSEGKGEHKRLGEYGAELQKALKSDEIEIKTKQGILQQAKTDLVTMQKSLTDTISKYEENIVDLQDKVKDGKEELVVEMPKFEELQQFFNERAEEFEAKKKAVVELKNKKASLETSVERLHVEIEKLEQPLVSLRQRLGDSKSLYYKQLNDQTEEMKNMENKIWVMEEKLSRLYLENSRFTEAITHLEQEHQELDSRIKKIVDGRVKVEENILYFKDLIEQKWKEDMNLDKEYYAKDVLLLDDITKLQEFTKNREKMIDDIYQRLDDELGTLSSFIDHVAGHRP